MPVSEAQKRAINKYQQEKMEIISFRVKKDSGKRERYKALAEKRGVSLAALIQQILDIECEKEGL